MHIKHALLYTAAALITISRADAADAVIVAEPEPVEYVRVCDAYGSGFFYIPGTETCLKVSGYVRYDIKAGDDVYNGGDYDTWQKRSRATIRFDARSETELGTLRSYAETRFDFLNGDQLGASLQHGYIELSGFRVGISDELFGSWTGYAGGVISDDVINYQSAKTNQISYTFKGGNGFSALIGAEQGQSIGGYSYVIDDYMPHVLAGAKFEQDWGSISGVGGYDSVIEEWAGKLRLDLKFTDKISAFVMGGYQSNYDEAREERNWFGTWQGDYAVWAGLAAKVTDKATINGQIAYEEEGTVAAALNVAYQLVPGFMITPEIDYTSFSGGRGNGNDDAFGGILRFQRNF